MATHHEQHGLQEGVVDSIKYLILRGTFMTCDEYPLLLTLHRAALYILYILGRCERAGILEVFDEFSKYSFCRGSCYLTHPK